MGKNWKNVERKIAKQMGGERVPITGRSRGSAPDIDHNKYSIEVKHRKELPEWIKDAMDQAEQSNTDGLKVPIVILHEKYSKYENSFVIIKLKDLLNSNEL